MKKSLFYQVLIGMLAGIFTGLFFGGYVQFLKPFSDALSKVFQMAVLPYIATSLMHGLGSLSPQIAKKLLNKEGVFLLLLWALTFTAIFLMAFLIPTALQGGISQELHKGQEFIERFLSYIIPENPFYALANNIVPAVAVLGLIVGSAIMHLPNKEPLLGFLERINSTIEKIFYGILSIAPIAAFLHFAVDAGTFGAKDLMHLGFFIAGFIALGLFLTFVILPLLLTHLTPMRYREVLKEFGFVSFFGFAVGHTTITLPLINQSVKRLSLKYELGGEKMHSTDQMIVPLGFSFGQIGNVLMLFFVLYASYYFRIPFGWKVELMLPFLMVPISLGTAGMAENSLSFLLDQLHFSSEAFSLFLRAQPLTEHIQVLLSATGVLTFVMLVLFAYYQKLQLNLRGLIGKGAAGFAVVIVGVFLLKPHLDLKDHYTDLYSRLNIQDVISDPPELVSGTPKRTGVDKGVFPQILKSGVLRVGYDITNIPFCYRNPKGELQGYDLAFAYQLAKDLDCKLELIPLSIYQMVEDFQGGLFDIGIGAVVMTEDRLTKLDFSQPYYTDARVLVVPEKNSREFLNLDVVKQWKGLKLGGMGAYASAAEKIFPLATVTRLLDEVAIFDGKVDAVLWDAVGARAWCLEHPEYIFIDYGGGLGNFFLAYPVPLGNYDWVSFVNSWLDLKREADFTKAQENYWIKGEPLPSKTPQWSILRNVLHRVD